MLPAVPSRPPYLAPSLHETFEVSIDPGSPISLDYFDRQPYAFEGKISAVSVQLRRG
jgi:arylsulfatase